MHSLAWFRPCLGVLPSGRRHYHIPPPFLDAAELSICLVVKTDISDPDAFEQAPSSLSEGRQSKLELSVPDLDAAGHFKKASRGGGGTPEEISIVYDGLPYSLDVLEVEINVRGIDAEVFSTNVLLDRLDPRSS